MSLNNTIKCFIIWLVLWALVLKCTECRTLSTQVSSGMQTQKLVTSESNELIRIKRYFISDGKCAKEHTRILFNCIESKYIILLFIYKHINKCCFTLIMLTI